MSIPRILTRIQGIQRQQRKIRATRAPSTSRAHAGGGLLELVPRLSPHLHSPDHLAPIAAEIERSAVEPVEVCISVPPRHGKTTLVVHAIVWILLRDPTAKILYASFAHGFASKQVRRAMRLAQRAGIALGDMQRRDEWTTAEGGSVKAAGVGGQIVGEGFTHVFVDDPHKNRAEAESRIIREGVVEGFQDDIYTRQDPRGTSIFVVHTRWHERDLIGSLTQVTSEDGPPPFRMVSLPALDGAGRALAPLLFTAERLLKLRARVGEYTWASLYQGSPRPRGGADFGDATTVDQLPPSMGSSWSIGVDIAHTARTRSDYNAAVVMRKDHATDITYVVEVVRLQGALTDKRADGAVEPGFARKLAALQARYPTARTVAYTGRDEELVLSLLSALRDHACHVEAWPSGAFDKRERAQPYAAAWRDRRVVLPQHAMWLSDFVLEHAAFTGLKGDQDDQVDAAAAAWDALHAGFGVRVDSISGTRAKATPKRRYT